MGPTLRLRDLRIEIAPATCPWSSLRAVLTPEGFTQVAGEVHARSGMRCRFCGRDGGYGVRLSERVEVHELWSYDDLLSRRSLDAVVSVCPPCHEVLHMPLALRKGRGAYALAHLKEVNRWDHQTAMTHVGYALSKWEARSQHAWVTNLPALRTFAGGRLRRTGHVSALDDLSFAQEQVAARCSARPMTRTLQFQADPVTPGYAHQENH
jgi:hypothetical protein